MKIVAGNGIKELIAAITGPQEEKYGPPAPLNEAAIAAQMAHVDRVDPLLDDLTKAERALRGAREAIEDEQRRWARDMTKAMPELDALTGFKVCDDQKSYRPELDDGEKNPQSPAWVAEALKEMENGSGTVQ